MRFIATVKDIEPGTGAIDDESERHAEARSAFEVGDFITQCVAGAGVGDAFDVTVEVLRSDEPPTPLPADVRTSIAVIVEYNWANEEADYVREHFGPEDGHVYTHLRRVSDWLATVPT